MARNQEEVFCQYGEWTELTNSDVSSITFSVISNDVYIRLTVGSSTPTENSGLIFTERTGVINIALSDLSSLPGANRVWAKPVPSPIEYSSVVLVDHS